MSKNKSKLAKSFKGFGCLAILLAIIFFSSIWLWPYLYQQNIANIISIFYIVIVLMIILVNIFTFIIIWLIIFGLSNLFLRFFHGLSYDDLIRYPVLGITVLILTFIISIILTNLFFILIS